MNKSGSLVGGRSVFIFFIFSVLLSANAVAREEGRLTFYKDIQPIIYRNCTGCHRAGQCAPFELITYKDMLKHATTAKYVINAGYMPPWKADTGYSKFAGQRSLTSDEINTISNWIDE